MPGRGRLVAGLAALALLSACDESASKPDAAPTAPTTSSAAAPVTASATSPVANATTAPTASATPAAPADAELPKAPADHAGEAAPEPTFEVITRFDAASERALLMAGERVAVVTLNGTPKTTTITPPRPVAGGAFATGGDQIALWLDGGAVAIVDVEGKAKRNLPAIGEPKGGYPELLWSGDDGWLAGSDGQQVHVWDVAEGKHRHSFAAQAFSLGFGYDGHRLAAATSHQAWVWDAHTGRLLESRSTRTGGTFATVVSRDANWVASAEEDGHGATLYQSRPWQLKSVLANDTTCDAHIGVHFARDSRIVFAQAGDSWIRAYATKTAKPVASWSPPKGLHGIIMSDDAKSALALDDKQRAHLFVVATKAETQVLDAGPGASWTFAPNGRRLVATHGSKATIFTVDDGAKLAEISL